MPGEQPLSAETREPLDLAYWAWTIIANVSEGNWVLQTEEWREAAVRWRDAFHAELERHHSDGPSADRGENAG